MSPIELQSYIRGHIPVAEFMQVRVIRAEPELVELSAPIEPNLNVHGTLFGGSGAALGLVAAWSLVFTRMQHAGLKASLVVHRQNMTYYKPVSGAFTITATFAGEHSWPEFVAALERKHRGRVDVVAVLQYREEMAARLEAEFAATQPRVS